MRYSRTLEDPAFNATTTLNTPVTRIGEWIASSEERAIPKRILILAADGSSLTQEIESALLRILPVLRRAGDSSSLLRALEDLRWDAIILDALASAPLVLSALRQIRHYDPDVPVIAVIERAGPEAAKVWAANGVADLVDRQHLDELPLRLGVRGRQSAPVEDAAAVSAAEETAPVPFNLADNLPDCCWLYDVSAQRLSYTNNAYHELFGAIECDDADWPACWTEKLHPDDVQRLADAAERARFGGLDEEVRLTRPDGGAQWLQVRTFAVRDAEGVVQGVGGMARDITASVQHQLELYNLTRFDGVTALPNRLLFLERLSAALALARRNTWQTALLFIDLDRFKLVNDTLGHRIGDALLNEVAIRLRGCLRDSDTVGRLGGDEFAVILPDLENLEVAAVVARKIIDILSTPIRVEGEELYISASIGITLFPDDADDAEALVRNADAAMYLAKESGRGTYAFYTAEMNARARFRMGIENDLRRAVARQEFILHYQPKVCCRTGEIVGAEALLRWQSPERGMVGPIDFVPVLEETGLIVPLGEWILETACLQMVEWRQQFGRDMSVAVNLSPRQLRNWDVFGGVQKVLERTGLPASALELELTESVLMEDEDAAVAILSQLQAIGVRVAVDDFGTGYSSLAYLKRFPLDSLKVDRSFVQDITARSGDASITRAVIRMGHELALRVVAEGVETAGQLDLLVAAGCDQIQGYFFSRPLPPEGFAGLLQEGRRLPDIHCQTEDAGVAGGIEALARTLVQREQQIAELSVERDRYRQRCENGWRLWCQAMDAVDDPLAGLDGSGLVAFTNRACERVLGPLGLMPGVLIEEVLPLMRVAEAGVSTPVELGGICFTITTSPLQIGGADSGTLLHFRIPRDVTEPPCA